MATRQSVREQMEEDPEIPEGLTYVPPGEYIIIITYPSIFLL